VYLYLNGLIWDASRGILYLTVDSDLGSVIVQTGQIVSPSPCPAGLLWQYNIMRGNGTCSPCPVGMFCVAGMSVYSNIRIQLSTSGVFSLFLSFFLSFFLAFTHSLSLYLCLIVARTAFGSRLRTVSIFLLLFSGHGKLIRLLCCYMRAISNTGGVNASACPSGFQCRTPALPYPTPCAAGFRCLDATSSPVLCAVGKFAPTASTTCFDCPPGKCF
jgi:hypothetical protein